MVPHQIRKSPRPIRTPLPLSASQSLSHWGRDSSCKKDYRRTQDTKTTGRWVMESETDVSQEERSEE